MSEYQYYEFQALDRPLSREEMQTLRRYSSRALITPTSFVNEYSFGSFKGNEDEWMAKYFDAFLYVANWGTQTLMLRLPLKLLPEVTVLRYGSRGRRYEDILSLRTVGANLVLSFSASDEGGSSEWIEGQGLLGSLLPIRAELVQGDLRTLYLAWLRGIQEGDANGSTLEPAVPEGLKSLTPAQLALIEFLKIDPDLVSAAAETSRSKAAPQYSPESLACWVAQLPREDVDRVLIQLIERGDCHAGAELRARFEREIHPIEEIAAPPLRTIGQLLNAANEKRVAREHEEATQAARLKAQQESEAATAREKHLESLAIRIAEAWEQVDERVSAKQRNVYAEAVQILWDLREVASRQKVPGDFSKRLAAFRACHTKKKTFIDQLDAKGL